MFPVSFNRLTRKKKKKQVNETDEIEILMQYFNWLLKITEHFPQSLNRLFLCMLIICAVIKEGITGDTQLHGNHICGAGGSHSLHIHFQGECVWEQKRW